MCDMERKWRLGEDLNTADSIIDGVSFDDLILAVHCNCKNIDPDEVWHQMSEIIKGRMEDAIFLVENNMDVIIEAAMRGRE